jgi:hypothetical protein
VVFEKSGNVTLAARLTIGKPIRIPKHKLNSFTECSNQDVMINTLLLPSARITPHADEVLDVPAAGLGVKQVPKTNRMHEA